MPQLKQEPFSGVGQAVTECARPAEGTIKLLRQIGANVVAACIIIDLPGLGGAAKLRAMDVPVRTPMVFEGH